jgi:hypothetical protein
MQREAGMSRLGAADTAVAVRRAQRPHGRVSTSTKTAITRLRERTPTERLA